MELIVELLELMELIVELIELIVELTIKKKKALARAFVLQSFFQSFKDCKHHFNIFLFKKVVVECKIEVFLEFEE